MKKIIVAILAILMLLSAFSMAVAAQEEENGYGVCIMTDAYVYLNGERSVKEFVEWLDNETAQLKKEDGEALFGNDLIPTGATLKYIEDEDEKEYTFILPGDVNRDGKVQIKDARLALRIAVGIEELKDFLTFMASNVCIDRIDHVNVYKISIIDARAILRYSVQIETKDYFIYDIIYQIELRPSFFLGVHLRPEYANPDGTYSLDLFENDLIEYVFFDNKYGKHILVLKNPGYDNIDFLIYSLQRNPYVYNVSEI